MGLVVTNEQADLAQIERAGPEIALRSGRRWRVSGRDRGSTGRHGGSDFRDTVTDFELPPGHPRLRSSAVEPNSTLPEMIARAK